MAYKKNVDEGAETSGVSTPDEKNAKKARTFKQTELIKVGSVSAGKLVYEGEASKKLYRWLNFGDVIEMEVRDILGAFRGHKLFFKPSVVILDKDFIDANAEIEALYETLYTPADIKNILSMEPSAMKNRIEQLPGGVRESLKDAAVSMIDSGQLDSVARIKVLDEIFGTKLLLKVTQ